MTLTTKTARSNGYTFEKNGQSTWVGDSGHLGTEVFWSEKAERWCFVSLDGRSVTFADKIAAVRICEGKDADAGLNQALSACDLDGEGLWIVDADFVSECEEGYVEVIFSE